MMMGKSPLIPLQSLALLIYGGGEILKLFVYFSGFFFLLRFDFELSSKAIYMLFKEIFSCIFFFCDW